MADNVAITAGSGTTIATDDAGAGGHVQLVKLAISTDGSATLIPAEATNGLDVDVTRLPLPTLASGATVTSANDSATSATLLSSSATRKGFRVFNDSTSVLYVKYGTTASATDYTVQIQPLGYLEENHYYGRVDGIWSADASGAAKITDIA